MAEGSENLRDLSRYYRIFTNTQEMVISRGFEIQGYNELTLEQFLRAHTSNGSLLRDTLSFDAYSKTDPTNRLFARFIDHQSVGVGPVKEIVERMMTENYSRAIIITSKKLTPSAVKVLDKASPKYTGEVFEENELQVNITKHVLVPQHVVLTPGEKAILLERYHLKETQLPRIQQKDPIARYYGLKRGEVVKIVRASETAGRYLTYRLCL